jgi:hypothetical protein
MTGRRYLIGLALLGLVSAAGCSAGGGGSAGVSGVGGAQPLEQLGRLETPCQALGPAADFAALGLENTALTMSSGNTRINGNAGIGESGVVTFSGGGIVSGVLDADPTAQVTITGGSTFEGGVVSRNMSHVEKAAYAEGVTAGSLTPTQTFGSITSSQTIVGNGKRSVILVNGVINLSGGKTLTISGTSADTFIFQVIDGLQLSGGSNIVLSGVLPKQVLFYFPGSSGSDMVTTGNSDTAGAFLAPAGGIVISGGVHTSTFISGTTLTLQSGPNVTQACPANTN